VEPRAPRRLRLAGLLACALLLVGASPPESARPDDRPALTADAERLVLPPVAREDLLEGAASPGSRGRRSSVTLDVEPPRRDRGWELTVRAASMAGRDAAARLPRVYWKLDSEPPSDYRPLDIEERLVKRTTEPTRERITIDVVFGVDWNVTPGRHDVELLFSVEPL